MKKKQALLTKFRVEVKALVRDAIAEGGYRSVRQAAAAVDMRYQDLNQALNQPPESGRYDAALWYAADALLGIETADAVEIVIILSKTTKKKKSQEKSKKDCESP